MKKNLPISLLVLFTVFTVLPGHSIYQNLSKQHRSYSHKETGNNYLSFLKTDITIYPGSIPQANVTTIQSKNQNGEMIGGSSQPEHKVKLNHIVLDEIWTKETKTGNGITRCCAHHFSDDPLSGNDKKTDDRIENQEGGDGIVLVRLYFEFTKFSGKKLAKSHTISVSQKTGG